jgi:hypothetical protein
MALYTTFRDHVDLFRRHDLIRKSRNFSGSWEGARAPARALPDQPALPRLRGQVAVQLRKLQEIGFELGLFRRGRVFLERGGETQILA